MSQAPMEQDALDPTRRPTAAFISVIEELAQLSQHNRRNVLRAAWVLFGLDREKEEES